MLDTLTPRETQIARLVMEGRSNKEIAAELGTALATVRNQMHTIFEKLDCRCRTDLARLVWMETEM